MISLYLVEINRWFWLRGVKRDVRDLDTNYELQLQICPDKTTTRPYRKQLESESERYFETMSGKM
jgi:hypothetical protein